MVKKIVEDFNSELNDLQQFLKNSGFARLHNMIYSKRNGDKGDLSKISQKLYNLDYELSDFVEYTNGGNTDYDLYKFTRSIYAGTLKDFNIYVEYRYDNNNIKVSINEPTAICYNAGLGRLHYTDNR